MQELFLFNTLTRKKELFTPIEPGKVKMYTCGPTVYNYAHIGNFRSYVFADLLRRTLGYFTYEVHAVENITDVGHLTDEAEDSGDDKVEEAARRAGMTAKEIADFYTKKFLEDSKKLNILAPNIWAHATVHIGEQIAFIEELEGRGYTYITSDGVYFDTSKSGNYGALAKLDLTGLEEGARVKKNPEKRHPTDFALWKFSPRTSKRQMEWDSPWGVGFPGWHIECSAMSRKYLGFPFDIHTGGIDHVPIHHTNEIAQNEGAYGEGAVNYWLHNEFITVDGEKMAKSLGNIITIEEIEKRGFSPLAYRYFLLGAHYRQKQNFTWEALAASARAYDNLVFILSELPKGGSVDTTYAEKFNASVGDDLGLPNALAVVWTLLKDENVSPQNRRETIMMFDAVLGLNLSGRVAESENIPEDIRVLLKKREEARDQKLWQEADRLREELRDLGYEILDGEGGTRARKIQ